MIQPMYNFMFVPFIPPNCDKPPTIYSILNAIVNGAKDEDEYTSIKDLANAGRTTIFNFTYPLSSHITKADFESMILKHYMMRRIGFETVTAFRINLDAKLNEIMPIYNKMFDALDNWNIFNDGEKITRTGSETTSEDSTQNSSGTTTQRTTETTDENSTSNTTSQTTNTLTNTSTTENDTTNDKRYSDTPQDRITDIQDGKYVTDYTYEQGSSDSEDHSTSNGTSSNTTTDTNGLDRTITGTNNGTTAEQITGERDGEKTYQEIIQHTNANKIEILKEMQENIKSIYTLIFKDLDILFYGIE